MPAVLAFESQKQVRGQSGLNNKFQTSRGYTWITCNKQKRSAKLPLLLHDKNAYMGPGGGGTCL